MRKLLLLVALFTSSFLLAQNLEGTWLVDDIENNSEETTLSTIDNIHLDSDTFYFISEDSLVAQGTYIWDEEDLVLQQTKPTDTIYNLHSNEIKEDNWHLQTGKTKLKLQKEKRHVADEEKVIPSMGLTFTSLWRGALGIVSLLLLAVIFSSNRRAINWRTVGFGVAFQLAIAIGVLKVPFIQVIFEAVGQVFVQILDFTKAGSEFLFGDMMNPDTYGFIFAFQVLPTILFFSALTSVLFYLGIIQKIVAAMAWLLSRFLHISGAESLSVAGNIFLGQTEAPLLIKAYLDKMTKSEILLVMVGGMATVAGAVLAAYIGFLGGDDPVLRLEFAKHLLAASVMAAPGAIVVSKILYPETEEINNSLEVSMEKIGTNFLDAIANGTSEGLKLAVNVGAMLLVFVAFIAMINGILLWVGDFTNLNPWIAANSPYDNLSLESLLGTIFSPLMWLIGVANEDVSLMGQLLGIKLAASEFIGYIQLAELKNTANALHFSYEKSIIMATYMLCGFANFASIGIQIGGIGSLAPSKRKTLSKFGMKALLGGSIASLISATIAGMIIG